MERQNMFSPTTTNQDLIDCQQKTFVKTYERVKEHVSFESYRDRHISFSLLKIPVYQRPLAIQVPPVTPNAGQSDPSARDNTQNGPTSQYEAIVYASKKLQDDLRSLGLTIKKHEDNIKLLNTQNNRLDESILDMQVTLGKFHSSSMPMIEDDNRSNIESEAEILEHIIKDEKSAAGIFCKLKSLHGSQTSNIPLVKDVCGIVALLGKVEDDNLSRLLSEYLGSETMVAIVCKTMAGVKALETYEEDGSIIRGSGLHGLGESMGRLLEGRFNVICLDSLRPYSGDFIADDPQRRLDIPKPRLPNGGTPSGFLGYAVNMVEIDTANLSFVTVNRHGLRETLFYNLFSHLQVYRTKSDMSQALPFVRNGAISLDGGIMKTNALFSLGHREEIDVKFPKICAQPETTSTYSATETMIQSMKWRKQKLLEDIQREQTLLVQAKSTFEIKRQEFVTSLAVSSPHTTQYPQVGRG